MNHGTLLPGTRMGHKNVVLHQMTAKLSA